MKNQSTHKLATISFVTSRSNKTVDLWPLVPTAADDYELASQTGRDRAIEIIQYARENQAPMVIGHVAAAIMATGVYGAAEIAFFHQIATYCLESPNSVASSVTESVERRPNLHLVTN